MIKFNQKQIFIPSVMKIAAGEMHKTGYYLKEEGFNTAAVFFSDGIETLFGNDIHKSLDNGGVKVIHESVISDINIENVIHTAFKIPKAIDVLIGVGGGKALDYSKYCAHVLGLPFFSIPTSVSNDGFCSPNSSLLVEGKRKSVSAKIPYGVIVDIDIIKTSPESSLYSGMGDLISKITAGHDWLKAAEITGENFNDFANILANNIVTDLLCETSSLTHQPSFQGAILPFGSNDIRNPDFLYHIANSLMMSGVSMEIAGSSRPASGSEHLISHAYDQIASKPSLHGLQVGVATYVCSYLQDNRLETIKSFLETTGFFDYMRENPLNKDNFLQALQIAHTLKEDFYTILSEKDSPQKAEEFIQNDTICREVLK